MARENGVEFDKNGHRYAYDNEGNLFSERLTKPLVHDSQLKAMDLPSTALAERANRHVENAEVARL
jgi:hypothetical protein